MSPSHAPSPAGNTGRNTGRNSGAANAARAPGMGQGLRSQAEGLAAALPPLLADAEHLAQTVLLGAHGRRRAGQGDEFWQYRPLTLGDEARMIDWRRSAKSDQHFVREKEWQAAQSVMLWADEAQSMRYSGHPGKRATKAERARLLSLAVAVLLVRAGERVGLARIEAPPRSGPLQLLRIADALGRAVEAEVAGQPAPDYGAPRADSLPPQSRAVFFSDFLGDISGTEAALTAAADRGVRGAMLMVLDPVEEEFPFDGRTIFESMGGSLAHETRKAGDLRARYLERLAARKDRLEALARETGWLFGTHHTDSPAQGALLWLYAALERGH